MRPDTRTRLLDAVHRRAVALARVTAPEAQGTRSADFLIAMTARNLFSTVVALCGPSLLQRWLEQLFARELDAQGICPVCGAEDLPDEAPGGMCRTCWQQAEQMDEDVQRAAHMRRPAIGSVS